MQLLLDAAVAAYFKHSNAHDAEALAALFADDGHVHDEQEDHRGRDAIRDWAKGTFRKYGTKLEPREASGEGGRAVVISKVSGNFPGSPVELRFRFVTDSGKIVELEIS
jgi:ketosteroid isomerase-like protein